MLNVTIEFDPESNRMAIKSQLSPANTLRLMIRAMVDCASRVVDRPEETKVIVAPGLVGEPEIAAKVSAFIRKGRSA